MKRSNYKAPVSHLAECWAVRDERLPKFLSEGKRPVQAATTSNVPMPPLTTEKTGLKSWATSPDSKPPISLEEPTKMAETAWTRPRISLGVPICEMTRRMTMLTLSKAPVSASISSENQKPGFYDSLRPRRDENRSRIFLEM